MNSGIESCNTLKRINRILMLKGSFISNLGLLNGKMGIVIFFFIMSKYSKEKKYKELAGEMIDEIYKEIYNNYPISFENGLAGIAWGIEYLIRNNFVKADSNDVLGELDEKILEWDIRKVNDYSLETGLEGIAHYVISRCIGKKKEQISIPKDYIYDLITALENSNSYKCNELSKIISKLINGIIVVYNDELINNILEGLKVNRKNVFLETTNLGIKNGYAGLGIKLLKEIYEQ